MGIIDDLLAQYGGFNTPQSAASGLLGGLQAMSNRQPPSAPAAGPDASAPATPASLPIPPAEPWIWLSPDGSISYTGRQPSAADSAQPASSAPDNNPLSSHALTLMALGAGIAQGGVGRGLQQAVTAAEADRKQQVQRYGVLRTYDALTDAGVPRDEARAAIYDPHVMRAVAIKYFGPKSAPPAAASAASAESNGAAPSSDASS